MVFLVTSENRALFQEDLLEMHRQRKAIFVDRLHWQLPVTDGLEIDDYDGPEAIYLLITDDDDEALVASARLLKTDRPHPLGEIFPHLCSAIVPRGASTWEASRFCPRPDIASRAARLALLWQIICGILETALLFDIERITLIANRGLLPCVLNCGWDAQRLGPTCPDGEDEMTAVGVWVDSKGLRRVRTRYGVAAPIIRFYPPCTRIAA